MQALEAGVVRLYAVVMVVGLRYSVGVHRGSSLWDGLRGVAPPAGPFLYPTAPSIHVLHTLCNWFIMCLHIILT